MNEPRLWFAVDYARRLIREGEQPHNAAAFARVMGLDADAVRRLATAAEQGCRQTRATLRAEQEARASRGEQEPTP